MIIGGLQKTSVIDYPGRVACVLFCAGCNFHCPYCHNPDLISSGTDPFLSLDAFFDFLEKRRGFLDGVVITGGEPSLNDGFDAVCEKIKAMGMVVKLDTNGSRPEVIERLAAGGLVDYLAMDVKTRPENYPSLLAGAGFDPEKILTSIGIIRDSGIPCEFRTTCVRPFVDDDIIKEIASLIVGAPLYVLQQCRLERVLAPDFFEAGAEFTEADLERFRDLAAGKVGRCLVR